MHIHTYIHTHTHTHKQIISTTQHANYNMQHNKLLSTHNRDQFIEGLCDGDVVKDLLQESGLILSLPQ